METKYNFMYLVTTMFIITEILVQRCESTLFRRDKWTKVQQSLPPCKLLNLTSTDTEAECGRECKYDDDCVYFNFDCVTSDCLMCTTGDISASSRQNFTFVANNIKQFNHVFQKVNFCSTHGGCAAKDCSEYKLQGFFTSGVYTLTLSTGQVFPVYCDMETDGGGWTVFQRRIDGSEDFYKTWAEYEAGFGNLTAEFWLGNSKMSSIISQGTYQMRVDMSDFDRTNLYIVYNNFNIDGSDSYRLTYGSTKGNIADSFCNTPKVCANGQRFSAKDKELDTSPSGHCSVLYKGAWWYGDCHSANPNGLYYHQGAHTEFATGIDWKSFHGYHYSLRFIEMKIRPTTYVQPYKLYSHSTDLPAARDCADHRDRGITTSGIYSITSRGRTPMTLNVFCDMDTNGGGWLVFQRRSDGSVDFIKTWVAYQDGFGNLTNEFWLGNEPISDITDQGSYELRIDMEDFDGNKKYATYDFFTINRQNKYRLLIGKYSGNAGDSLSSYHNGSKWSTFDSDNDGKTGENCALQYKGAWWYNACHYSNLNGQYLSKTFGVGVNWDGFRGREYSLKVTEMKIRPAGYTPRP